MNIFKTTSAIAALITLGALMPASAQREGRGERGDDHDDRRSDQKAKADEHGKPARPAQTPARFPQQRSQQQDNRQRQPQRIEAQARSWQQQKGWNRRGGWPGHDTFRQDRAQHWATDHRTWTQRGGYGGSYIPRNRFALNFGSQHTFRLGSRPVMYMGYPRFEHDGFSFLMVDPWPEYWSDNWYAADDLYIDYDDGYYLRNRRSPDVRLAITLNL